MNRPLFGFRPNLQNERHRRAWEILQAVPDGQKNAFLVQAILESEEKEAFETTLRRVLREELQTVPSQPVKQPGVFHSGPHAERLFERGGDRTPPCGLETYL